MQRVLRPLAQKRRHKEAFWRGWLLTALDGTQHSVTNTPQNNGALRKAKARRGRAAFAKITTCVLLELGLHNPLAAAIGHKGQSEWELSLSLLARLPKKALLLADRLSGCAAFAAQEIAALMLAAALLARERDRAAAGKVPVLRVSFIKLLELMRPWWLVLALGEDLLEEWQKQQLTERFYEQARTCLTPERRLRSCQRKVRQPVSGWPRLLETAYAKGPVTFAFV